MLLPLFSLQLVDGHTMTGRTLFAMLIFAGIIAAVMWFLVLPAVAGIRPTVP